MGRIGIKCVAKDCDNYTFRLYRGLCDACQATIDKDITIEKTENMVKYLKGGEEE